MNVRFGIIPGTPPTTARARTRFHRDARRAHQFRPDAPEVFEERVVPAIDPAVAVQQGLVAQVGHGTPKTNGFFVDDNGELCGTIQLTQKGIELLEQNAGDGNPNNDSIIVGIASYILTKGDSTNPEDQVLVEWETDTLTLDHTSTTICVVADDVLCTQVDAYATDTVGAPPLEYDELGAFDRLIGGAIFHPGEGFITNDLSQLPPDHCPDSNIGNCGLSPGYWKTHESAWQVYTPTTTLGSVFSSLDGTKWEAVTFRDALSSSGTSDPVDILMVQAVAALLNAAHDQVEYPLETAQVKAMVNTAVNSGDKDQILDLKDTLDGYNNLEGCTLTYPNTNSKAAKGKSK